MACFLSSHKANIVEPVPDKRKGMIGLSLVNSRMISGYSCNTTENNHLSKIVNPLLIFWAVVIDCALILDA